MPIGNIGSDQFIADDRLLGYEARRPKREWGKIWAR